MFEHSKLNINETLIHDCAVLINEHNQRSYKKVSFQAPSVEYRFIKVKDIGKEPLSKEIISFYEAYSSQMYALHALKAVAKDTEYTYDDVALNIDMSSFSIVKLLSELEVAHTKLLEHIDNIEKNALSEISALEGYIKEVVTQDSNVMDIVSTVFVCMKQLGITKANIDESLRLFIPVGVRIISTLHELRLLSIDNIAFIKRQSDELKQIALSAAVSDVTSINRLQQFGIVPDEGPNHPLQQILKTLFGLDIPNITSIKDSYDIIEKQLKLASGSVHRGLIIHVSPNEDVYFDTSSLFNAKNVSGVPGITESMVHAFNLIKVGTKPVAKAHELMTININVDSTQSAYVLWTNNYKTFKVRTEPIGNGLIRKLVRGCPSPTIESFNQLIERIMDSSHANDSISYNKVKYMSFTDDMDERQFLDLLSNKLQKGVEQLIGKVTDAKTRDRVNDKVFEDMLFDILEGCKAKLGVPTAQLSSHCHIIYGNMAVSIVGKIKKQLLSSSVIDKSVIKGAIDLSVHTNDNIYSRIIASHYLHIV